MRLNGQDAGNSGNGGTGAAGQNGGQGDGRTLVIAGSEIAERAGGNGGNGTPGGNAGWGGRGADGGNGGILILAVTSGADKISYEVNGGVGGLGGHAAALGGWRARWTGR